MKQLLSGKKKTSVLLICLVTAQHFHLVFEEVSVLPPYQEIHSQMGWYSQEIQGLLCRSSSVRRNSWGSVCHGDQTLQSVELAVPWQWLLCWP